MSSSDGLTTCSQCGQTFPSNVRICPNDGTVLEHAAPETTRTGLVLDGKYRLDALVAEGGMGAVYRATHVMLGKKVAIKLIRAELGSSPEIVRRFQREARAANALNHPNIVAVYDLGQTPDGTLYIAMEFIEGPSLKTVIQTGRPIPPLRTIAILRQVASALATAHKHNIIHRDLKPQNIMLATGPDGSEQAKLVDFGIAKTFDEATQLTSLGSSLGTPYYMSPEQIEGRAVDARSDIYALGIILYEMLAGRVPFADQSTPAVLIKQLKERPEPPSVKNPAVPPALEAVALRCLEKDPEQRYQTADEFAAALDEAAAHVIDASAGATMPMASIAPGAGASAAATAPTAIPPAASVTAPVPDGAVLTSAATGAPAAAAAAPAATMPPAQGGTRPTVPVPQVPAAIASPTVAAAPRSSSMAPLIAIAAVLLLLAGGYLVWSNRQPSTSATSTQSATSEPPKASPAMASQEPSSPAPADARQPSEPAAPPESASTASTPNTVPAAPPPPPAPPSAPPPPAAAPAATTPPPVAAARTAPPASTSAGPSSARAPNQGAATAAATREALAARTPPATAAPAAVKGATSQAVGAQRAAPAPPRAAPAIPENAAVIFRCSGAPDVCASLRSNVNDALDKAGFRVVSAPDRADIAVGAVAGGLQEKISHQFGQTFATRTYQIELSGEAPKLGDTIAMPPATTVSFDASVGRERLEEKSRLVAGDIVERIRAFIQKKRDQ